jgi:threonylcarbamoyladenosine tRNA methylthiotransferase MtaB
MRVAYRTFGCKANQYDTERMRQEVEARGAVTSDDWSDSDVVVVNTCTVTNQADADARRFIRRARRENPDARIVVAGCSAALRGAEYRSMDEVEAVIEGHDPVEVAGSVAGADLVQIQLLRPLDEVHTEPVGATLLRERRGGTRGWLKVQDGCDRKCSFCATRLARGESRSRPAEEIVREARVLAELHPELVITGIHIGHYGLDLDPPSSLSRLVALLLRKVPDVRFRLGSVEATEVDDLLLDLLADGDGRLAPHLHMPLQSGADPVLRRMRRWHTREMYRSRAMEIVERVPRLGLGADVITGFPGETVEDHRTTRDLITELPFTYLHVFPYSPRDGTAATDLPDPVPQRIAGERARELRELGMEKGSRYRQARVGEAAAVVLEGAGGSALTGDYLRVGVAGAAGAETRDPGPAVGRPGIRRGTLEMAGADLRVRFPA